MAIFNKTMEILATEVVSISRKIMFNCNREAVSANIRYNIHLQCQNAVAPLNIQTVSLLTVFKDFTLPKIPYFRALTLTSPYEYVIENMPVYVTGIQTQNGKIDIECYYEYNEVISA